MVEVFRTNVKTTEDARAVLEKIHQMFGNYKANFDLEDCDRILRVEDEQGVVEITSMIGLLKASGFTAEVLSDEPESLAFDSGFITRN